MTSEHSMRGASGDWLRGLWRDERGGMLSTEYILLGTLLTLGLIVGIAAARDSILSELEDYAAAILGINCGGLDEDNPVTFQGNEQGRN